MKETFLFIFSAFFILSLNNVRSADALASAADTDIKDRVEKNRVEASGRIPIARAQRNEQIRFRTIDKGVQSAAREAEIVAIRNSEDWAKVWAEIHANQSPQPPLPAVDFSKNMVIAAFQGEKPTGGYEISIERVTRIGDKLRVVTRDTRPGRNCAAIQVLTSPYHLIELAKFEGKILYQSHSTINQCLR